MGDGHPKLLDYQTPPALRSDRLATRPATVGTAEVAALGRPFLCAAISFGGCVATVFVAAGGRPAELIAAVAIDALSLSTALVGLGLSFRRIDSESFLGTLGAIALLVANAALTLVTVAGGNLLIRAFR